MEFRLQAWHDTRASAGLEIQTQQSQVDQMEAVLAEKQTSTRQLKSSITSGKAKIERPEEELKAEVEALAILGMTKDDLERSKVVISEKLELSKQKLAKIKQEAAKTLSLTEESFKVALQCELERTYTEELTKLEQQVRSHKLHVD
ncbi:myosin-6-like [Asparagus officinalis]|uniref:myosin-6-like n=1 Tax=Asparagus officinalis TaxID=4686 RepID=UPI00098E40D8|nr:myosin-6-like [Asparagus officinalis]